MEAIPPNWVGRQAPIDQFVFLTATDWASRTVQGEKSEQASRQSWGPTNGHETKPAIGAQSMRERKAKYCVTDVTDRNIRFHILPALLNGSRFDLAKL